MRSLKVYEWIGIALILIIGIIHIYTSPDEFKDAPYLGIMFVGAFLLLDHLRRWHFLQ